MKKTLRLFSFVLVLLMVFTFTVTALAGYEIIRSGDWRDFYTVGSGAYLQSTRLCQWVLYKQDYDPGVRDGYWGTNTKNAIKAFQKDHGLDDDGYCGPNTWNEMAWHRIYRYTSITGYQYYMAKAGDTSSTKDVCAWMEISSNHHWRVLWKNGGGYDTMTELM